jgi:hypothetical protein
MRFRPEYQAIDEWNTNPDLEMNYQQIEKYNQQGTQRIFVNIHLCTWFY